MKCHRKTLFYLALCASCACSFNVSSVPTYCIDGKVQSIFQTRIDNCLNGHTVGDELTYLRESSVAYYQAAQELVAYEYFTDAHNPLRRACGEGADLEYIPLLPLAWKAGFSTRTSCTAGGVCPRHALSHPHCDMKRLVDDILVYVKYAKSNQRGESAVLPFVVTGALDVKSVLAHGMPTQMRRGTSWNNVMWFVGNVMQLHHHPSYTRI